MYWRRDRLWQMLIMWQTMTRVDNACHRERWNLRLDNRWRRDRRTVTLWYYEWLWHVPTATAADDKADCDRYCWCTQLRKILTLNLLRLNCSWQKILTRIDNITDYVRCGWHVHLWQRPTIFFEDRNVTCYVSELYMSPCYTCSVCGSLGVALQLLNISIYVYL